MKFSSSAFQRFEACACMSVMITRVRPLTWTLTRKCRCMVVRRSTSHSRHVLCRWGCGGSRLWSCWSASGSAPQWTTSCEKDYPQMENTQGRWPGVDVLQVPPELRPRNAQWNGKNPKLHLRLHTAQVACQRSGQDNQKKLNKCGLLGKTSGDILFSLKRIWQSGEAGVQSCIWAKLTTCGAVFNDCI